MKIALILKLASGVNIFSWENREIEIYEEAEITDFKDETNLEFDIPNNRAIVGYMKYGSEDKYILKTPIIFSTLCGGGTFTITDLDKIELKEIIKI